MRGDKRDVGCPHWSREGGAKREREKTGQDRIERSFTHWVAEAKAHTYGRRSSLRVVEESEIEEADYQEGVTEDKRGREKRR